MGCSDKIAELNFLRFQEMKLERNLTPAVLSYEGIQYQYMRPKSLPKTPGTIYRKICEFFRDFMVS